MAGTEGILIGFAFAILINCTPSANEMQSIKNSVSANVVFFILAFDNYLRIFGNKFLQYFVGDGLNLGFYGDMPTQLLLFYLCFHTFFPLFFVWFCFFSFFGLFFVLVFILNTFLAI
jgi:hypothetical protein